MADTKIQKTDAIILKKYPLRETSLLLILYTKDFGKIKGVIKGVRGPRAQFGSYPEILTLNRIVFYEGKRKEFFYITQCDLLDHFRDMRMDLERTSYATYMAELAEATSVFGDKNEEFFELLLNGLRGLCSTASPKRITRIFEIKLLILLGLMPTLDGCAHCRGKAQGEVKFSLLSGGLLCKSCFSSDKAAIDISAGTVKFIKYIEKAELKKTSRVKVSKEVGEEVEDVLRRFLDAHIEKKLKTIDFLKKIEAKI